MIAIQHTTQGKAKRIYI